MLNTINHIISFFAGDKSKRDIKSILPVVMKINQEQINLSQLSDDGLREKTLELKQTIKDGLKEIEEKTNALKLKMEEYPEINDTDY